MYQFFKIDYYNTFTQLHYFKQCKYADFEKLLETSKTGFTPYRDVFQFCDFVVTASDTSYRDYEKDQMTALDSLAAYHVQVARNEKSKEQRKEHFAKVWFF